MTEKIAAETKKYNKIQLAAYLHKIRKARFSREWYYNVIIFSKGRKIHNYFLSTRSIRIFSRRLQ